VGSPLLGSNPQGNGVDGTPRLTCQPPATSPAHSPYSIVGRGPRRSRSRAHCPRITTTRSPKGTGTVGTRISHAGRGTCQRTSQGGREEGSGTGAPRGREDQNTASPTAAATTGPSSNRRRGSPSICDKKRVPRQREPGDCTEAAAYVVDMTDPTRSEGYRAAHGDDEPPPPLATDYYPTRNDTGLQSTISRASGAPQHRKWPRGATQPRPSGFSSASANCPSQWSASSGRGQQGVITMTTPPNIQPQRALPFSCPLCLSVYPTRKQLLEHLRSDPRIEHKTFRFGATESPMYPMLMQQGVMACPRGCGAFFNGGDKCISKPLELHIGRGRCHDRRPLAAPTELNGPYMATTIARIGASLTAQATTARSAPENTPPHSAAV